MGNFLARLICEHITFNCDRLFLAFKTKQKKKRKEKLLPLNRTIKHEHQVVIKTLVSL